MVDRLYALPPEEFTAARDAAAKQASGDLRTQLKALRRPTASAALVNRLRREQPDLLDQLLELGPALAQAQAARSGDELRALGQQRRELVEAVVATAADGASAAVRTEVEQTLEAALADPAAADAVRSGALVRALSFAGFGGVDVAGAVAAPPRTPSAASQAPRPARGVAAAERAAQDAAAALDDAVGAAAAAARRAEDAAAAQRTAEQERGRAQEEVDDAERRLAQARERLAAAGHEAHDAQAEVARAQAAAERAVQRVAEAQEAAAQARDRLDRLRRR